MIIVTGATGQLGRAVVEHLLELVPAAQIGVSVRDPSAATDLAERGVRVRRGDFAEPDSLVEAFDGATQVLVVSVDQLGESARTMHRSAVEAARDAGVRRILYTSHVGARPGSPFAPGSDHDAAEAALRHSGVAHTSLRNGFYVDAALRLLGPALQTGTLAAPADGPVNWTAPSDLAAAAAAVLAHEGEFDGPTPPLVGNQSVDLEGLAALASEVHGRTITRVIVGPEEYRDGLIANGVPEPMAEGFLGFFTAAGRGDFASEDRTLERLIGRPPVSARDALLLARPGGVSSG